MKTSMKTIAPGSRNSSCRLLFLEILALAFIATLNIGVCVDRSHRGDETSQRVYSAHSSAAAELKLNSKESEEMHYTRRLENSTAPQSPPMSQPVKIAFCLTGQLARLEIKSKVRNIFAPNVRAGNLVHVMVYLDNEVAKVKQTFWKFDYSNTPYFHHTTEQLAAELQSLLMHEKIEDDVRMWLQLASPGQDQYDIVDNITPVSDKIVRRPDNTGGNIFPDEGVEKAQVRFQNNMRWLGALRDCTKWVQRLEYEQGFFYDLVVRLREDTYAFGPWILNDRYRDKLSSASSAAFRGINDHNFVIGRLFADDLFRGITEDYYLNGTLANEFWGNPEGRIYQMAVSYNIPIQNNTVCDQPLLPLRGKHDEKHWSAHALYTQKLLDECSSLETRLAGCICNDKWIRLFKASIILVD